MADLRLEEEPGKEEPEEDPIIGYIDLFVSVGLLLMCLVTHLKSSIKIPVTGPLIVLGVLIRLVGRSVQRYKGTVHFGDNIEKEMIELIFLPILIAECAISLDWHHLKQQIGQIVLLAIPAVILSSFLTAFVIRYILNYHELFSWYEALMMGAILSATDHVTVVAILKEVKADEKLMTLMQSETLLNDGTVFVLFTFAMKGATRSDYTSGDMAELFFRQSLGGIALGIGFSLALSFWLYNLVNEVVIETVLTLATAYLLFYTSTLDSVDVSGALGTVIYGLYMSAYGKAFISPMVEHQFHAIWKTLGTSCEALILLLCGSLIGGFMLDTQSLKNSDIGLLFGFFIMQYVVRAITIIVHYPLMWFFDSGWNYKHMSRENFDYKKMLILIFGGLKGTISISLALIAHQNSNFSDIQSDLMLFWAVGSAGLCNTLGALGLFFMVKWLKLEDLNEYDELISMNFAKNLMNSTAIKADNMCRKMPFREVHRAEARHKIYDDSLYVFIKNHFPEMKVQTRSSKIDESIYQLSMSITKGISMPLQPGGTSEELQRLYTTDKLRKSFLHILKSVFNERFEKYICYRDSLFLLVESVYYGIDKSGKKLMEWDYLEKKLLPERTMKTLRFLKRWWVIGRFFAFVEKYFVEIAYDIARNFIAGHKEAQKLLIRSLPGSLKELSVEIIEESKEEIYQAKKYLKREENVALFERMDTMKCVQTNQIRLLLLYRQNHEITEAFETGMLNRLQYLLINEWMKKRLEVEERFLINVKHITKEQILKSSYVFGFLQKDRMEQLVADCRTAKMAESMEEIKEISQRCLLIVLKGKVRDKHSKKVLIADEDVLGIESLFESNISLCKPLSATGFTLFAKDLLPDSDFSICVQYFSIAFSDLHKYVTEADRPEFSKRLWAEYGIRATRIFPEHFGEVGKIKDASLPQLLRGCTLSVYKEGRRQNSHKGFVCLGATEKQRVEFAYCKPVKEGEVSSFEVIEHAIVALEFQEDVNSLTLKKSIEIAASKSRKYGKSLALRMTAILKGEEADSGSASSEESDESDESGSEGEEAERLDGEKKHSAKDAKNRKSSHGSSHFGINEEQ